MVKVKIIRSWTDKNEKFKFGMDINGKLYCRDLAAETNLVLVDSFFKKKAKFYYKFVNPKTQKVKLVERQ